MQDDNSDITEITRKPRAAFSIHICRLMLAFWKQRQQQIEDAIIEEIDSGRNYLLDTLAHEAARIEDKISDLEMQIASHPANKPV